MAPRATTNYTLTVKQSQALALKAQGMTHRQIADRLGVAEETIAKRVRRAKDLRHTEVELASRALLEIPDHDNYARSFARELLAARHLAGISQATLAERAGVSANFVFRLEKAQRAPSRDCVEWCIRAMMLDQDAANVLRLAGGYAPRMKPRS